MAKGVYKTNKKDGSVYYRVSITYKNKHISIGSYDDENTASQVYCTACDILFKPDIYYVNIDLHTSSYAECHIDFPYSKFISLINFRDNGIYIKTPIYLCNKAFLYFLEPGNTLIFSIDDLFYYSHHTFWAAVFDLVHMVCRQAFYQDLEYAVIPLKEKITFSGIMTNTISDMKMCV